MKGDVASLYGRSFFNPGDMLSFRYYMSSDLAIRAAVRMYKSTDKLSGEGYETTIDAGDLNTFAFKNTQSEYYFVPGIEKHFLKSNVFDVFMGGDALLGIARDVNLNEFEASDGTFFNSKTTSSNIKLGLGYVVGFNVFVAQLPISVGVEYGLSLLYTTPGKAKVELEDDTGTTEYYTYTGSEFSPASTQFSTLKSSSIGMDTNQNVRIVLNVYFGK